MKLLFKLLLLLLLLGGESGIFWCQVGIYSNNFSNVPGAEEKKAIIKVQGGNLASLRRIKDIDCWQFNTKIGKVILTDYKWENHIQIRHPFVTTEAIRKALEHPRVMYKSNKRWIFEKDNLRVVVGNDKVITAYYMDGR